MSERSQRNYLPSWVADPRWIENLSEEDGEEARDILRAIRIRGFVDILDKVRLEFFFKRYRMRKYNQSMQQDNYKRSMFR